MATGDLVKGIISGIIRGVVSWAVWALGTMLVGTTILKTQETEAGLGASWRGPQGFAQNAGTFECTYLHTGTRGDPWYPIDLLANRHHDNCRSPESGLHLDSAGILCDFDCPHSGAHYKRNHLCHTVFSGLDLSPT